MADDTAPVSSLQAFARGTQTPHTEETQATCGETHVERSQGSRQPSGAPSGQQRLLLGPLRDSSWKQVPQPSGELPQLRPAEQRQASPTLHGPNCRFVSKISDYCFKPLSFEVVCYAANDSQNGFVSTIDTCHI